MYHYPLLNFIPHRNIKYFLYLLIIISSTSIFTTYLLEKPLRTSNNKYILSIIIITLNILFILILINSKSKYRKYISSIIHSNNYNRENENSFILQSPFDVNYNWKCNYYHKLCWCPFFRNNNLHNEEYILKNIFKKKVLFLIGDSHLEQWSFLIYPYSHTQGYTLLNLYCNLNYIEYGKYDWLFGILNQFRNKYYAIISNYLYTNLSSISFNKYIYELLNSFKLIYIIQDTPHYKHNPNNCLIQNVNKLICFGILNKNVSIIKYPSINDKRLFYIDLNNYICDNGKCPFIYKGYPVYKDNNHLNLNFTYFLKDHFFQKGFKLNKVNDSSNVICDTAVWCRRDWNRKWNKCPNNKK